MTNHEEWLRKQNLGGFIDNRPAFLNSCDCNGDNMEDVCKPGRCVHYEECRKYFQPLADALERYNGIGEV